MRSQYRLLSKVVDTQMLSVGGNQQQCLKVIFMQLAVLVTRSRAQRGRRSIILRRRLAPPIWHTAKVRETGADCARGQLHNLSTSDLASNTSSSEESAADLAFSGSPPHSTEQSNDSKDQ